uniref:Uncharacterized protein n=1 Tax=Anguilla anguilla TaxID=7936 RepID=A0A0E9WMG7_ANGAN
MYYPFLFLHLEVLMSICSCQTICITKHMYSFYDHVLLLLNSLQHSIL